MGGEEGYGYRTCGLELLREPCVVYSFGSNDDFDFEESVKAHTACEVHIFDPAPSVSQHPMAESVQQVAIGPKDGELQMRWWQHSAPVPTPARTLQSIMLERGHRHIDVLKVDIEGSEHAALTPLGTLGGSLWPLVGQLILEVHLSPRFPHDIDAWRSLVNSA